MSQSVLTVSDASFDADVLKSDMPVLVDFWAEWCGPCKQIDPIIREIATEQAGALTVAKLNVDDHGDIAVRFNVQGIPALLVFKDGVLRGQIGKMNRSKSTLLNELSQTLG